jgi:hypothetical protein
MLSHGFFGTTYFPTCQVRVVAVDFMSAVPPPPELLPPPPDFNCKRSIAVAPTGPEPQAQDQRGPRRTRTASPGSEWSPPDLNSKPRSEWSPQDPLERMPEEHVRGNARRECQRDCQMECQIRCQIEFQIECQNRCQIECQNRCQKEWYIECQDRNPIEC